MKKHDFKISFSVTESELNKSDFVAYLIWVFQVGRQQINKEEIKKFFWDLPSKYSRD